jgi:hypothetical protein
MLAGVVIDIEGGFVMTLTTAFLATALFVPAMPPPEYDDCEVVTNCVFDASRGDAKMFAVKIGIDATPSNGVEVVFGRDADGDEILSRTEEAMAVGYDCGEWKVVNLVTGDKFTCDGASGRAALDWKLRLNENRSPLSLAATVNGQPTFMQLATCSLSSSPRPTTRSTCSARLKTKAKSKANPTSFRSVISQPVP